MPVNLSKLSFLFVSLVFVVACGSSSGDQGPSQNIITMTGTVEITGDRQASGAFEVIGFTRQPSCAAYAQSGDSADDPGPAESAGRFRIPGPVIGVPLDPSGDVYASTMSILPATYGGPDTYVNNETITQIEGGFVLEDVNEGPWYFPEDSSASATINADGSGSITFTDVPQDTDGIVDYVSGTVTWTCSESAE